MFDPIDRDLNRQKKLTGKVKEDWGRKTDRIHAIKHAAMALDHGAPIFCPQTALYG